MKTIAIISQKGGAGKSTLAVGLAIAACRAGKVSVVIDTDPQPTATRWKARRGDEDAPAVVASTASRLKATLAAAEKLEAELAIIDTAPRSEDGAAEAARLADIVLIPIRADMANLETLPDVKKILTLAGNKPAFVVLNGIHPNTPQDADEARAAIRNAFGLECVPVAMFQRLAYSRAFDAGRTPNEIKDAKQAAAELAGVYEFTCKQVYKRAK